MLEAVCDKLVVHTSVRIGKVQPAHRQREFCGEHLSVVFRIAPDTLEHLGGKLSVQKCRGSCFFTMKFSHLFFSSVVNNLPTQ